MLKASDVDKENEYDKFPYSSKILCYIEQTPDGKIKQIENLDNFLTPTLRNDLPNPETLKDVTKTAERIEV